MLATLKESISVPNKMICLLHPWQDPVPFRRVWCLFEMHTAITLGAKVIMVSGLGMEYSRTASYTYMHTFLPPAFPTRGCQGLQLEAT
jgi:hypothetical protein